MKPPETKSLRVLLDELCPDESIPDDTPRDP